MYCKSNLCKSNIIIITLMLILSISQLAFSQESYLLEIDVGDVVACQGQTNVAIPIYMKNYADTVAAFSIWLHLDRPDIMEFQTNLDIVEYSVYYIYTEWDSGNPPIPTDSIVASPAWVCIDGAFPVCADSALMLGYYKCTEYIETDCTDSVFIEWTEGIDPVYTELYETIVANFDTVGTLTSGWEYITARSLTETGIDILITAFADYPAQLYSKITPGIGFPQEGEIPLIKILVDIYPLDETETV